MKFLLLPILALFFSCAAFAQIKIPKDSFDKDSVQQVIQKPDASEPFICQFYGQMPEFLGGDFALHQYIEANLVYPDTAIKNNIQGIVRVRFVIEEDGSISNAKIVRPLGYGLDEEVLRLINSMPKWKSGENNGKAIRVPFQIPIKFVLP
jgi:TonB family protein